MGLQDQNRIVKTYTASGAIRQFRFVKLSAANTVEECDTAGEAVFGIAETAAADTARVDVCIFGLTKIEIGADTTINTWLSTADDGQATDNDASDDYLAALGLEDGTAATERISCWFPGPSHLDQVGQ
jgi:hypothetical protein